MAKKEALTLSELAQNEEHFATSFLAPKGKYELNINTRLVSVPKSKHHLKYMYMYLTYDTCTQTLVLRLIQREKISART